MREETLRIVDQWLNYVGAIDWSGATSLMADDITLHLAGRGPFSGTYQGKADVVEVLERIDAVTGKSDEFVELIAKMADDQDHASIRVRKRISAAGKTLEYTRNAFYAIKSGKMAEVWITDGEQADMDDLLMEAVAAPAVR